MKKIIFTNKAPAAIGPYSQAVQAGNTLYISGQLGLNPATGEFAGADTTAQTTQVMANIGAILNESGFAFADIVKTTVLLKDIADFGAMNEVYGKFFPSDCPARAAFQVANLPKGGLVEIEVIAYKD